MAPITRLAENGDCTWKSYEAQRHHSEQIYFQYFTIKLKMLCGKSGDKRTLISVAIHLLVLFLLTRPYNKFLIFLHLW